MKKLFLLLTAGATTMTQAAITETHLYELGETGTLESGIPQDSVGSSHFTGRGGSPTANTTNPSPVSGTYTSFDADFNWGADFSGFATDNFAVELWVRTSNLTQGAGTNIAEVFRTGTLTGALEFYLRNDGNWMAGYQNVSFIGGGGAAAVANEWVNLAVIRDDGVSAFYIDGQPIGSPVAQDKAPVFDQANNGHLAVASGGVNPFTGDIDNIRMFTFEADDDPVAALTVNAVPEPSTTALLGLGGLALILRRRKG
ncbi:LamG domain-containing protein [Verrucomicrobiaceae bacterium N1E253]|uniref:LamG domain-containing protein n=1 Tax=Oceaniferula marina TaxID=2748318 RepID=A0A851G8Z4_9BACT|nr:LamG-like jellyroll fold domain-containing protein [Oceaniferula marina]NWK54188.1 LamG domain-containing protein [Oceaniferula marina]